MFEVLTPPKDDVELAKAGGELLDALKLIGMPVAYEGLLRAWIDGMRVLVQRDPADPQKRIIGVSLLTVGRRWIRDDFSGTILDLAVFENGDRQGLVDFTIQIAKAQGATKLLYQPQEPRMVDGYLTHHVIEISLQ